MRKYIKTVLPFCISHHLMEPQNIMSYNLFKILSKCSMPLNQSRDRIGLNKPLVELDSRQQEQRRMSP